MASYTVTITPEGSGGAQATLRIDVEHGSARVTEVVVRPAAGLTIADGQLSIVDMELLLRAVQPAVAAIEAARSPAAARPSRTAPPAEPAGTVTATADTRAYRKMPDDLAAVFEQIGSVTRLAAHYGVPRHTAQGWVNRLRKQARG